MTQRACIVAVILLVMSMLMLVPVIDVNAQPTLTIAENYDDTLVNTLLANQTPLPEELTNYYDSFREKNRVDFLTLLGLGKNIEEGRMKLGILMNYMVVHDAGGLDTSSSKLCKEYLENVSIKPLKENKSILLQTGETLSFEELDRLAEAKLIYYYVRDHIYFPHPGEKGISITSCFGIPEIIKFPGEIVGTQHGICCDQALLLATLLKMEGYEVAVGSAPEQVPSVPGNNTTTVWMVYHSYVFLKDEGWDIGNLTLNEDIFGNKLDGKWIFLDPIYSPRHFQDRSLEFGEFAFWWPSMKNTNTTWEPQNELLFSYELIDEEIAKKAPYA